MASEGEGTESAHPGQFAAPTVWVTGLFAVVYPKDGKPDDCMDKVYVKRLEQHQFLQD